MSQRRDLSASHTSDLGGTPRRRLGTPGASSSPQMPGQVPDRSGVPGRGQLPLLPSDGPRRPLTQFGTAQEIMGVYAPKPGQEDDPARFEQATAAFEELRKADPSLLTPIRPLPGYDLDATPALAAGEGAPGEIPALAEGVALTAGSAPNAVETQAEMSSPSDATLGAAQAVQGGALPVDKDGRTDVATPS